MNIDKDIEIVKEFIKKDYEPWSFYEKQGDELFELQEAIENVLSELEKKDKIIKTDEMMLKEDGIYIQELKSELETYKKIVKLIIKKIWFVNVQDVVLGKCSECSKKPQDINECTNCIINHIRKEVEKDV